MFSARSSEKFGRWPKKVRPYTLCSKEVIQIHVGVQKLLTLGNMVKVRFFMGITVFSCKFADFMWKAHVKKFGPFSAIFCQICIKFGRGFSRPLRFLWGHFCVLRPKFRPVGNTVIMIHFPSVVLQYKTYIRWINHRDKISSFKIFLENLIVSNLSEILNKKILVKASLGNFSLKRVFFYVPHLTLKKKNYLWFSLWHRWVILVWKSVCVPTATGIPVPYYMYMTIVNMD
jgi:hypothetical protein